MENLANYLVKNPKQIALYFNKLASNKCLVAASFGDNTSFLTAILNVDEKKQRITIDCGPKEYLNKELLSLGIVDCKSDFQGIKVLFQGRDVKKAGKKGQTALSIQLPKEMYWVQRRRFYRVRSPLSKDSYCSIIFPKTDEEKSETLNFKLFDLSVSGFAILSESKELAQRLTVGIEYQHCTIVLENKESHVISFTVQTKYPLNANKPTKSQRIGCQFINPTARAESTFITYMQEIERELKKNFD